jgi:hypothetical protein
MGSTWSLSRKKAGYRRLPETIAGKFAAWTISVILALATPATAMRVVKTGTGTGRTA